MRPLIAAVADVHLAPHARHGGLLQAGVNSRARMIADVLAEAVRGASEAGAGAFVVCGDLHDVDDPAPQVLALSAAVFANSTVPVVLLVGNHDQRSTLPGDHCLGPLAAVPGIYVIERPTIIPLTVEGVDADLLAIPFEPSHAREYIPARIAELSARARPGSVRIVAAHVGVSDARTSFFLRDSHEAIPASELLDVMHAHGVAVSVVGNWHDRHLWSSPGPDGTARTVVQCGALVPTGWDNPGGAGRYGGVVTVGRGGEVAATELPGPRFFVVRRPPELAAALADPTARPPFVRWDDAPPALADAIRESLDAAPLGGYDVVVDRTSAEAVAEGARTAAQATTSAPAAVRAYVLAREYPAGVTPAEVLAAVEGHLGTTTTSRDPEEL